MEVTPRLFAPALCAVLLLIRPPVSPAQERALGGSVDPGRLALLSRGINLSAWFSPWANPAGYATAFRPEDASFLKKAGFTVCRLPLAPDLLFDAADPSTLAPEIRHVDRAVRLLLDAGLAVVLDPVHGDSSSDEWERGLSHDTVFRGGVERYWEALARHFAALSSERIFLEVMNEPHLAAREKIASSWWGPVQESLVAAIRRGAPLNTIIVTGERWGGIDGLLELKPLSDRNIVYSFHWYDPFPFTHQGAEWAGAIQAELSGIPYPSSPSAVERSKNALADPAARSLIERYGRESWDESRVRAGLRRAADWAAAHGVPLFCGEFGVYRKYAPAVDRLRWIGDVRRSLEALGIGWCMWDYDTDFGIVTYSEPGWRRGARVDAAGLSALGLDAATAPAGRAGGTTAADFADGTAQSLDIPVDAWARLWTREPGAGGTAVVEDAGGIPTALAVTLRGSRDWALGSNVRVPVKAGEALELSSRASLEGPGTLSLEAVARDAEGNVTDWSAGAAPVAPGPLRPVVSRVVVPRGVASLEPRWSGAGPSRIRVEAFLLVRTR